MELKEKAMGLYIHIPFCTSKCAYCDFVSFCLGEDRQIEYLEALFSEIDLYKCKFKDRVFDTIYIGGGTPSTVFGGFIERLAEKIFNSFVIAPVYEFTIEVNPNSFDEEKFLEYTRARINRISVGVQCINERVTKNIGRVQMRENIERTFDILNKHNFQNISADIMLGLPNETDKDILNTIKFFACHNVKHISAYSLQVEEGTPLFVRVQAGESVPNEDECRRQYDLAVRELKKAGYERYEISNFALPDYESRHNSKYWQNIEYLGLGVSAHSFYENLRVFNTPNLEDYINKCKQIGNKEADPNTLTDLNQIFLFAPIEGSEELDENKRKIERIMLSLRTSAGLDIKAYNEEFSCDFLHEKSEIIDNLKKLGAIEENGQTLRITDDFFYLSNAIIEELI